MSNYFYGCYFIFNIFNYCQKTAIIDLPFDIGNGIDHHVKKNLNTIRQVSKHDSYTMLTTSDYMGRYK